MKFRDPITFGLVSLLLLGLVSFSAAAEEGTVKILAPWESSGQAFPIAESKVIFYGAGEGIMYIENATKGTLNAAIFTCPGTREINLKKKTATSSGHCVIDTTQGDDLIFATYSCTGPVGACDGKFTLTGGTGRFKGVTGSSKIQIRTALGAVVADTKTGAVVKSSAGLAIWPELRYKIPAKK